MGGFIEIKETCPEWGEATEAEASALTDVYRALALELVTRKWPRAEVTFDIDMRISGGTTRVCASHELECAHPEIASSVEDTLREAGERAMKIVDVIVGHGSWAYGQHEGDGVSPYHAACLAAKGWAESRFDDEEAEAWLGAGCFDEDVAADLCNAGITPEQAGQRCPEVYESGTLGYGAANKDLGIFDVRRALARLGDGADTEAETDDDDRTVDPHEREHEKARHAHEWETPIAIVGGCDQNPGVQSLGGMAFRFESVCRCGARRVEIDDKLRLPAEGPTRTVEITYPDGLWPWEEDGATPGERATFAASHEITHDGERTLVMLDDGSLYTREEWERAEAADWTLDARGLLFQGQVPPGESSFRVLRDDEGG